MRPLLVGTLALALLGTAACGSSLPKDSKDPSANAAGPIQPVAVDDEKFAASVSQLLLSDELGERRINLMAGVVRRQLARAQQRFDAGHAQAGIEAVAGALYLVHPTEFRIEMLRGSERPLLEGAAEVARTGDEGRAWALYGMLRKILPSGRERQDVEEHFKALTRWSQASGQAGPLQTLGNDQRIATRRALFEPTAQAKRAAHAATVHWITQAERVNLEEPLAQTPAAREELFEAYRAGRAGGLALVALYLHRADASGALKALEASDLIGRIPPGVIDRLQRAADDDPAAWEDLYRLFNTASEQPQPELSIDVELAGAAAWGSALRLYRLVPGDLRAAVPIALELVEHGMAEVAPVVLSASLTKKQNGGVLSMLASIVLRATRLEDDAGQLTAARRTFKNAAPIIALMTSPGMIGRVRPTAARLHYEMGVREMRGGELARARTHMDAAARLSRSQDALTRVEPMLESLSALAAIDRQRGDAPSAQAALAKIIALARKMGDVGTEAEALVTSFEIHRDVGAAEEASKSLRAALTRALDARRLANTDPERARSELTLARVLEHYGKPEAARRATQRAYEASRADVQRFAHTIVHAARRALTLGDLRSAREAVQRALDARLPDDDMIYVALWLQLLEKKLSIPSDGTAEEAYAAIESSEGWPAKLRAWGRGKLNDKELLEAAKDRTQRTEAIFYSAMANHVAGKSDHALPKLREVVKSEAVDLVEVTIARDLLAEQNGALRLSLPPGVELP